MSTVIEFPVGGPDLPAFQPGPLDAAAGRRDHRIELRADVPAGHWLLRLDFDAGHGPCPDLLVDIDGARAALFHPEVIREDRTEVYRHGPIAGRASLAVPLGPLAAGEHTLGVTTTLDAAAATGPVADPGGPARHREQFGHHFGSGITWRRITLQPLAAPFPGEPGVTLESTPLFIAAEGLQQLVDLTVTVPFGAPAPRTAEVRIAGRTWTHDLARSGRDAGHFRVRFPVPELTGPAEAEVRLDGGAPAVRTLAPKRKWTVHLIPHVHLDVGYTDVQGKVLELHSRNLDRALAALDRDEDFAFSVDGSLVVAQYLATRSGERAQRVLAALRSGRLSVNAFHSLFLSGTASLEEVYRAAYLAARLRDEHGVPVDYANLTDVPSYSAAVPSMLRALGIDAFVGIENHHRGGNADSDLQHLASPVMWEGVDGSRVLTHFSDTYSQLRFMAGDPQTLAGGAHALARYLARYEREDYLPHDLPVIGTHADNEDLADGDAGFAARWNAAYAWPRVEVSTRAGYLNAVRPLADRLPVWRGDGGSYWEDGVGTGAAVTAEHRRAQAALPVAEALAALVARADDAYRPNRAALDAAWEGALFGCEHTWTWSHANAHPHGEQTGDQLDWKRHQVHTGLRGAVDETRRALSQLGELVTTDGPTLLAHNPLSWARDLDIEAEAPAGTPFLLDGEPLPTEPLADCAGLVKHRLTVPNVPPFGYRAVPMGAARTLAPGEEGGPAERAAAPADDWRPVPAALTTDRWELALDPDTGAVRSLTHRATGRNLLDPASPWHLGDVLYVRNGPDALTRGDHPDAFAHSGAPHTHPHPPHSALSGRRPAADPPDLSVHPAAMRPVGLRRTYDGWRLRTVGTAPSLPHVEVDLLLRDGDDRVDVHVRLEKERELAKEAVYVAFPFAATAPRFHYDRQQGWIDPAADHAPGACHEWFTTQYGVAVETAPGGPAVVWTSADAPLVAFGDIVRGEWPEQFRPRSGAVLSWVMNNYWPTNTPPEQDGTLDLRYAFTPAPAFDPAHAGVFGRETRFPGVPSEVNRLDKFDTGPRPLPADAASLLPVDLPPGVHATVAEPRDRDGLLIRLQDLSGRGADVPLPAGTAVRCRADETPLHPLTGPTVALRPWEVVSLLLKGARPMKRRVLLGAALTGTALGGALTAAPAAAQTTGPRVGTWGAAAYPLADSTFGGQTGRFIVRTSVAGTRPRLRLSNVGGTAPLALGTVHFGLHAGGGAVAAGTNRAVTFGGAATAVIAAGAAVLSDPIDLDLPAEADVAVSIHLPDPVADVTGHSIAAQRSYLTLDGDHAAEESADAFTEFIAKWYLLDEITVQLDGPGGTVVCLGDSITDGVGSTSNTNRRWPDFLARRLLAAGANTGVLNAGVSGNRVLWDGAAPSAQARLDRDVLSHPGVHAVVLLEAINDIASGKAAAPGDLLAAYTQIRERLAVHGVRLVLGTVTPWLGSASYTDAKEAIRTDVNAAIRGGGEPYIDFEAAVRDPDEPRRLLPAYDSGGGVHPSAAGYEAMAAAVDLAILDTDPSL